MNMYSNWVLGFNFFLGNFIGYCLSRFFPNTSPDAIQLACGVFCVFAFTFPFCKRLGYLPMAPFCPNKLCGTQTYFTGKLNNGKFLKCTGCGARFVMKNETLTVMSEHSAIVFQYYLAWPKLFGRWKRIEL